jgi:lactate dehydrogenase-like 2-hydroxyacid dehydrogenase
VLVSLNVPMGAGAIEALPSGVGAIATYSVGTDHIDLEAARRRGIAVFNTPGVLSDAVAENALLLMLGAARRVSESVELLRSRTWSGWSPRQLVGVGLAGRRLGILGLGEIGARIATRAQAFGMEILYCNRHRRGDEAARGFSFRATPAELIEDADVFLIACPSTDETRGLVDAGLLRRARTGSILVNIARGDIVDDAALIDALRDGRVWAAGLDVFDGEPRIARGYFDLPNVFMLPHIGSSTLEARLGMGRILIEGLRCWDSGEEASNRVR